MKILSGDVNTVVTMKGEREMEKTESVWIDTLKEGLWLEKNAVWEVTAEEKDALTQGVENEDGTIDYLHTEEED